MKLAILSPTNIDFLAAELRKLDVETYSAPYGHVVMEAVNNDSGLYRFAPDVVMLFYDAQDVLGDRLIRPFQKGRPGSESAFDEIQSSVDAVTNNSPGTRIILNTIPLPTPNGMGHLEHNSAGGLRPVQTAHNESITALAADTPQAVVYDYAALAESSGLSDWYDTRMWFLARSRLSCRATSEVADDIHGLVQEPSRARAKVIVVDLDNTCWGGVIGDDGLGGIVLGTDGPGLAFASFQRALLNFRDQGVLLAIASKNDPGVVQEVFEKHPNMALSAQDITTWQVHWEDKAISIQRIAEELDLGVDSFVFFDDNPAERLRVAEAHPTITVIDVPSDPADFVEALLACRALSTTSITDEDLVRPEQYEGRGSRSRSSKSFTDIGQFLKSLEMQIEIGELSDAVLPRIAQLTQKTNQFNLRTQRYTEADLTRMVDAKTHRVFWLRLADRFGDEGIVAVAVVESSSSEWFLDTLLMSCRVLGRGVEQELVRHLKSEASATGVRSLTAEFLPSGRNELVRELLPSMNFTERNDCWELDTSSDGPTGPVSIDVTIAYLRE